MDLSQMVLIYYGQLPCGESKEGKLHRAFELFYDVMAGTALSIFIRAQYPCELKASYLILGAW